MKAYKLIAAAAAILLTIASLRIVLQGVEALPPASATHVSPTVHVTNLAPVVVHPSAAEKRTAALIADDAGLDLALLPAGSDDSAEASLQPLSLLGSQLVMPYYSFGKKFGRITKE